LTNEAAIKTVKKWKQVLSSSVVTIHDAFTTREFGDSSLILVTDYHPCSKSISEKYFSYNPRQMGRSPANYVREDVLWAYIVQIATALRAIHSINLAAQSIRPTKVLLTSKNRIRLNGCGIADIVQFDQQRPVEELKQEDFVSFGKLILCVASSNANATLNMDKALANLARLTYSQPLKQTINWLLNPAQPGTTKDIDTLLCDISSQTTRVLDSTFMAEDQLSSYLSGEIENGRLVRLMAKMGLINERPEFEHNAQWSETGERYYLKLFRDYVFHQVDANGAPVTDLAHIISCLNKLDGGSEEKVMLTSRDEQTCLVVTYRELKRGMEMAFNDLTKTQRR
jgi:PAB-dependent poly(A)-specific ribonuclease subunit 3